MMFAANNFLLISPGHGYPHVGIIGHAEVCWHHSSDEVAGAIEREVAPHEVSVRAEMILPETVTEQHDVAMPGLIFIRIEGAADHRLHTQRGEEIRRNRAGIHLLRFIHARESQGMEAEDGHLLEYVILAVPIDIVRR